MPSEASPIIVNSLTTTPSVEIEGDSGTLLCNDALERVMHFMDAKQLARCMSVSRQWRLCGSLDRLWAKHLHVEFGLSKHHQQENARKLFTSCMVGFQRQSHPCMRGGLVQCSHNPVRDTARSYFDDQAGCLYNSTTKGLPRVLPPLSIPWVPP